MQKRILASYSLLTIFTIVVFFRLFYISQNSTFATVSNNQSNYCLDVDIQRGMIYDCNLQPLVNTQEKFIASIIPTPEALTAIIGHIVDNKKDMVLAKIKENKPFLVPVKDYNIYNDNIEIIGTKQRYSNNQLAPHIIGYLNGTNEGVCGIEKAFNDFLQKNTTKIKIKYQVNALQNNFNQTLPSVDFGNKENKYGVVLTIDKNIQKITEEAALPINKGAIVVMDAQNGDLKSLVSIPKYNPNKVASYLNNPNSPLLNRTVCAYNVGSTYKLLVAAAALEEDYNQFINFKSNCVGCKQLANNIFKCHFLPGHGTIDMKRALEISCNPYFIDLALNVGPINILNLSKNLGFGSPDILFKDIKTHSGSLPDQSNLTTKSDIANLGFGQGKLTATPIQIAKMISAIANDGYLVVPKIVKGLSDQHGKRIEKEEKHFTQTKIISTKTAKAIKNIMISVVENGSGKNAKPYTGGAGGKTASAQTGHYHPNEPNKEIVHAWFSGFFPAKNPKYVIVVLVEDGNSGSDVAAPIFKKIADKIITTSKL